MIRVNENKSVIKNKDIKTERRVVDIQLPDKLDDRNSKFDLLVKI